MSFKRKIELSIDEIQTILKWTGSFDCDTEDYTLINKLTDYLKEFDGDNPVKYRIVCGSNYLGTTVGEVGKADVLASDPWVTFEPLENSGSLLEKVKNQNTLGLKKVNADKKEEPEAMICAFLHKPCLKSKAWPTDKDCLYCWDV